MAALGFVVFREVRRPIPEVEGAFVSGALLSEMPIVRQASAPPRPQAALPDLELSGRAALVKDLETGFVYYHKNANLPLAIASLTKLMTAVVVYKNARLDDVVMIQPADVRTEAYRVGLVVGEKVRVRDLLLAMLVASANDATLALARHAGGGELGFVSQMNAEAKILKMTNTAFTNPVGFDAPGHYSTVADLSRLVEEFLSYSELRDIVRKKSAAIASTDGRYRHKFLTTNKLMLKYENIVGLKTGYTAEAKGNLIAVVDGGGQSGAGEYYSIILGSADRERETEVIMKWVKDNFVWTP